MAAVNGKVPVSFLSFLRFGNTRVSSVPTSGAYREDQWKILWLGISGSTA